MASSIPQKDDGLSCELEAHTQGPSGGEYNGGWFTSLEIGGAPISPTLKSKINGPTALLTCAAWFTLMRVEEETTLWFSLLLDAVTTDDKNAAAILSAFIGAPDDKLTFTGTAAAKNTKKDHAKSDLLSSASIQGYVHRRNGRLLLASSGEMSTSAGKFQRFDIGVALKQSLDLQICFGGQVKKVWTVAPTV